MSTVDSPPLTRKTASPRWVTVTTTSVDAFPLPAGMTFRSPRTPRTPRRLPTIDVKMAFSPTKTADIIDRHKSMIDRCNALAHERADLFARLEQINAQQIVQRDRAAKQAQRQRWLSGRLENKRIARPDWGTSDYLSPVSRFNVPVPIYS